MDFELHSDDGILACCSRCETALWLARAWLQDAAVGARSTARRSHRTTRSALREAGRVAKPGAGWNKGGIAAQPDVADHAAIMNDLADKGFVLFAGPLTGSENARLRACAPC